MLLQFGHGRTENNSPRRGLADEAPRALQSLPGRVAEQVDDPKSRPNQRPNEPLQQAEGTGPGTFALGEPEPDLEQEGQERHGAIGRDPAPITRPGARALAGRALGGLALGGSAFGALGFRFGHFLPPLPHRNRP